MIAVDGGGIVISEALFSTKPIRESNVSGDDIIAF